MKIFIWPCAGAWNPRRAVHSEPLNYRLQGVLGRRRHSLRADGLEPDAAEDGRQRTRMIAVDAPAVLRQLEPSDKVGMKLPRVVSHGAVVPALGYARLRPPLVLELC